MKSKQNEIMFDKPSMIRLDYKKTLINDCNILLNCLNMYKPLYPKGCFRHIRNSVLKDVKAGLKVINKNNGVYIEMGKLTKISDGKTYVDHGGLNDKEDVLVDSNSLIESCNSSLLE